MSFYDRLRFYPTSLALRWRIASARRLLRGRFRWHAFDALGIPGFGSDLVRIDFPPDASSPSRWSHGRPPLAALAEIIDHDRAAQLEQLRACLRFAEDCRGWPEQEDAARPDLPWRDNPFLDLVDQSLLYGLLRDRQPRRYLEIGSGMSTRIAAQARLAGGFPMEIISIDPEPRVAVAALCDRVERKRLEDSVDAFLASVTPDSIVFFDGSHRAFPSSDVVVFFLEILPRLPVGTIVHIHDIFLPDDYPSHVHGRFWSEQYLLAAWLLGGGNGLRILLPCARLAQASAARESLEKAIGAPVSGGSSFWMEIVPASAPHRSA